MKTKNFNRKSLRLWSLLLFIFTIQTVAFAQTDSLRTHINGQVYSPFKTYKATATKTNDLVHTKLEVSFDYDKAYLYGKEWLTLSPHFYATDSLVLDAKGMDIKEISLLTDGKKQPLQYSYKDGLQLHITLNKEYQKEDEYTIYIDYTAKPNELKLAGGSAIVDAKGLFFINPQGKDPYKPTQIWTQGETESSSCWFPTIDDPNQKTTEEIAMSVPSKYVSLSNGIMVDQKENGDGTRTDTWKMDQPHSPYLFMMAVGDFKVYHDKWKDKAVDYYLEPAYAPYAEEIFGDTPEMMSLYSDLLGVDFPWSKYAQVVVRDYVSGAMENTTATLHGESIQKTPRELLDESPEEVICHELFHQWFGDYVTAESWSNITLNESFADYSETLWDAHKHGQDAGDEKNYNDMLTYMQLPDRAHRDLVNFYYKHPLQMFDRVSYQKGGRILHMLRHYVGDEAFFASLKEYLNTYNHSNAEAQQLRLVFEKVTGKDLSWFWDQWYYGKGYPVLDVNYTYDNSTKMAKVFISQAQDGERIFRLPMKVDVYDASGGKRRINYTLDAREDTLQIPYPNGAKPALIDVDAEKVLLAKINDHKNLDQFIYSYDHAGIYVTRRQAIEYAAKHQDDEKARKFLFRTLQDPYQGIRQLSLSQLDLQNKAMLKGASPILKKMAQNDKDARVRTAALNALAGLQDKSFHSLFLSSLKDRSYAVEAAALKGLSGLDTEEGYQQALGFKKDNLSSLTSELAQIFAARGADSEKDFFQSSFAKASIFGSLGLLDSYVTWLENVQNEELVKSSVKQISDRLNSFNNPRFIMGGIKALHQLSQAKEGDPSMQNFIEEKIEQLQQRVNSLQ
ncbi:MAG: M1 family metallopeptidase [Salegentibacter sp.]